MRALFIPQQSNRFHAVAIRQGALAVYVVFLLVFNLIIAPAFGLDKQAFASSISADRLVELANQSRIEAGVSALNTSSQLTAAAKAKGEHMFEHQYWAHYAPDGTSPWYFIINAGYDYVYAGENLAKDFITSDAVHNAWMNSPSHRDNLLNSKYKDIGIAVVDGVFEGQQSTIVVQMFGSKTATSPPPTTDTTTDTKPKTKTVETPRTPNPPTITDPEDGDILNTGAFTVRGTSQNQTLVNIYSNDTEIAEVTANEGIFSVELNDMQEGGHDLTADAEYMTSTGAGTGNLSKRSTPISITFDFTPPEIFDSSYAVALDNSSLKIEFNASPDTETATAEIGGETIELERSGTNEASYFSGSFPIENSVNNYAGKNIVIRLADEAGNIATIEKVVPSAEVLAGYSATSSGISVFSDLGAYASSLSAKQKVNIAIAFFLVVLFAIDGLVLWKMGIFRDSGNSTSHVAVLSLAIVAGLFGGIGSIV